MYTRKLIKTSQTQNQPNSVSHSTIVEDFDKPSFEIGSLILNRSMGGPQPRQNDEPRSVNPFKKAIEINHSGNPKLHSGLFINYQPPQGQFQKPKHDGENNRNELQSDRKKDEYPKRKFVSLSRAQRQQHFKNRCQEKMSENQERINNSLSFTEFKLNLNSQAPKKKYTFDFQARQKPAQNNLAPITANPNIYTNPQIQPYQPSQLSFNPTPALYPAQSIPTFPLSSNPNPFLNSISYQNVRLPVQEQTYNQHIQPIQYIEAEPPQRYMMRETNLSPYPQHFVQHSSNYSPINFNRNPSISPIMIPQEMSQNASNFYLPNNTQILSASQFQRNLRQMKEALANLPICYNFETIARLKIKDLKQQHKSFAFLIRNMRIIKTKIAEMMQRKYEIALKNKEIASQGFQKLNNLKKTFLFCIEAKNSLEKDSKTLETISTQLHSLEPINRGFLYQKESPFFNLDQGVILFGHFIRQKYRTLYQLYQNSVRIPQSEEILQQDQLEILQLQIEFFYQVAATLTKLQKKIKNLKMNLNSAQREELIVLARKGNKNPMKEEWRNLSIMFELEQILEEKWKRGG